MSSEETWLPIEDFDGYEVSNHGRVRGPQGLRTLIKDAHGYLRVKLRGKQFGVHRLVCRTFHGEPESPTMFACHKDHVKTNNHEENLHWQTPKQNSVAMIEAGRNIGGGFYDYNLGESGKAMKAIDAVMDVWRKDENESPADTLLQIDAILDKHFSRE